MRLIDTSAGHFLLPLLLVSACADPASGTGESDATGSASTGSVSTELTATESTAETLSTSEEATADTSGETSGGGAHLPLLAFSFGELSVGDSLSVIYSDHTFQKIGPPAAIVTPHGWLNGGTTLLVSELISSTDVVTYEFTETGFERTVLIAQGAGVPFGGAAFEAVELAPGGGHFAILTRQPLIYDLDGVLVQDFGDSSDFLGWQSDSALLFERLGGVEIGQLDGSTAGLAAQLPDDCRGPGLSSSPAGSLVLRCPTAGGGFGARYDLFLLALNGSITQLTNDAGVENATYGSVSFSPDGERLVAVRSSDAGDVAVQLTLSGEVTPAVSATQVGLHQDPDWADGTEVVLVIDGSGSSLVLGGPDGSEVLLDATAQESISHPRWRR